MEKEFVPYEQALDLKTLGFDEPCFATYRKNAVGSKKPFEFDIDYHTKVEMQNNIIPINSQYTKESKWVSAPLWQQAFKWFWNTQGLYVEFFVDDDQTFGFLISRFVEEGRMDYPSKRGYSNPEIAEFNCLKALIEIVKSI